MSFPFYLPVLDEPSSGTTVPPPNMPLTPYGGVTDETPTVEGYGNPPATSGGETSSPANVAGASTPDLIVLPGKAATGGGGGITVGTLAILALLGIGGYMLYKKARA